MKRLRLFSLVTLAISSANLGVAANGAFQVGGINYQVRENVSEVVVALPEDGGQQGYQYPLDEDGTLVIPSSVEYGGSTYTVTGVAKDAIVGQVSMTRLILPSTMEDVANGVHDCPALLFLDFGGASEVSAPMAAGLPLLEELRFGCKSPLALERTSFREMPALKVLRLPALYADEEGIEVSAAFRDCFQSTPLLEEIYCPSENPPLCIYSAYCMDNGESPYDGAGPIGIDNDIWQTCKVYVPVGKSSDYMAHRSWEAFGLAGNLIEMEFSGVMSPLSDTEGGIAVAGGSIVSTDGRAVEVYSLAGERMASTGLSSGVYVVRRQDGTICKVAVK